MTTPKQKTRYKKLIKLARAEIREWEKFLAYLLKKV